MVLKGESSIPLFLQTFNLRKEYLNILEMNRLSMSEDRSRFDRNTYVTEIRGLLKRLIRGRRKRLVKLENTVYLN